MNNLITKSQSLFLVAILAIFPSANAMSTQDSEYITKKMTEMYNHIKARRVQMQEAIDTLRDQVNAVQSGAANNNSTQAIKDISNNLDKINTKLTSDIKSLNDKITIIENAQKRQEGIDLRLSNLQDNQAAVRLQAPAPLLQLANAQGAQPRQRILAENAMQMEPIAEKKSSPLLKTLTEGYIKNYLEAKGKKDQTELRKKLTTAFQTAINGSNLKRGTDIDIKNIKDLVDVGDFSPAALRDILALEEAK